MVSLFTVDSQFKNSENYKVIILIIVILILSVVMRNEIFWGVISTLPEVLF